MTDVVSAGHRATVERTKQALVLHGTEDKVPEEVCLAFWLATFVPFNAVSPANDSPAPDVTRSSTVGPMANQHHNDMVSQ